MQGNIARWLKKEGDKISPGEVLCEVETVGLSFCLLVKYQHLIKSLVYLHCLSWKFNIFTLLGANRIKQQLRWNAWRKVILPR